MIFSIFRILGLKMGYFSLKMAILVPESSFLAIFTSSDSDSWNFDEIVPCFYSAS